MLEKIFGKKSTGVVYIVCAGVLLLSLIGAAVYFLANYPNASLYSLFVQALLTAFSLAAISAPVFIQKRFKFFIPPFIEIALCVYSVLLFLLTRFHTETIILNSFLPFSIPPLPEPPKRNIGIFLLSKQRCSPGSRHSP